MGIALLLVATRTAVAGDPASVAAFKENNRCVQCDLRYESFAGLNLVNVGIGYDPHLNVHCLQFLYEQF